MSTYIVYIISKGSLQSVFQLNAKVVPSMRLNMSTSLQYMFES